MEQMVARFKNTLHQEMLAMIRTKQHSRRPFPQSTSYALPIDTDSFGFPQRKSSGVAEANVTTPSSMPTQL
jgi:hypothetical protein